MKQHLKTLFPDATATELNELAYSFLMSTAGQATGFVRQQGAGVMDLEKAMKTKAYLTSTEGKRPKLELGDSENGEFAISFKLANIDTASFFSRGLFVGGGILYMWIASFLIIRIFAIISNLHTYD